MVDEGGHSWVPLPRELGRRLEGVSLELGPLVRAPKWRSLA